MAERQAQTKQSNQGGNPPGLRMNQLMDKSGLAKSTILLYVKEGLLQAHVKTSPNMAYYAPECVERLAMIKRLKNSTAFPCTKSKKSWTTRRMASRLSRCWP